MTLSRQISHWVIIAALAGLAAGLSSCRPAPPPVRPVQPGETVYFVPNTNRMLALTFDDGPNGAATETILDTLKRFDVKATFFLIGTNVTRYPDIARRIVSEGHQVGNHTFNHLRFDEVTSDVMARDIVKGSAAIFAATGVKPAWFRPPYGINGDGMEDVCRENGYAIAGWSGHAGDWNRHSAVELAERMITQATPGDVLLLHDGWETRTDSDRQNTVDAVFLMLERLVREGFRFVTLDELRRNAGPPLAEFSNGVRLLGLHVQADPPYPGADRYIRYFWDVPAAWKSASASAFVHFEAGGGFRFQDDHPLPLRGDVRDLAVERVLIVPTNAPLGRYQCHIGLFDPARPQVVRRVPVRWSAFPQRRNAVILEDFLDVRAKSTTPTPSDK